MRHGSKGARRVSFFWFPLFLSKSKPIPCFGSSDLNFPSLGSVLELFGDLLRPCLVMASPLHLPRSFLTVPCLPAFPAVRSECLAGEVEPEQAAWSDRSGRPWATAPPTYRFAFMFLFPVKTFLPLFFHKTCWKQLAKSRFALVC